MQGETILSIVMITVPERDKEYTRLFKKVSDQISYCARLHYVLGDVEIITVSSKKFIDGGSSIGNKRQQGLEQAKGKYVCWLDDDDDISPDYVETLLRLAYLKDVDVLTFNNISKFDNFWCIVKMDLKVKQDEQVKPGIVNRRPYHVCAFKRSLLSEVNFPDLNWDEDTGFIEQVLPLCKTQSNTQAIIHQYNRTTKSIAWESVQ